MLLKGGEELKLETELEVVGEVAPEAIPVAVVHEDDALLVIDKPVGLVVHPGAGNRSGTLQNALLHAFPDLAVLPRAGLVHRLDKDTSGLLLVARTLTSQKTLAADLERRAIRRTYQACAMVFSRAAARSTRRSAAIGASEPRWPSSTAAAWRSRAIV